MPGRRPWITLVALATLAVAAALAFVQANRSRLSPVVPGRKAPGFVAYDLQGARTTLRDFRGKVVLVNIWATWCSPCQEEMPSMQRLFEAVGHDDFEILAVSIDAPFGEQDATGRRGGDLEVFARRMGLTFRILHDPTGKIQEIYQTTGVPESFVVDRNGVIFKKVAGATAWDAPPNVQLIQRLLGG